MNSIQNYFIQSEFALAAYGTLNPGAIDSRELVKDSVGMSAAQATHFASTYTVLDVCNDSNGLSAMVFVNIQTGEKSLSIRGTELVITDYLADVLIIAGVPPQLNPQYATLKTQVQQWLSDGTLTPGFTVSGHSLGGYLAAGLVADFGSSISHAYLYNAPGNNSNLAQIMTALGVIAAPDASKISSLRADAGISPIAGLGTNFSDPIAITIENQLAPDVLSPPAARNHSQQVLTDALATYAVYSALSPALSVDQIAGIIKSASNRNVLGLESSLDALRAIFLGQSALLADKTPLEDRAKYYANLYALQGNADYKNLLGQARIESLTSQSADGLANLAKNGDIDAKAYRYALKTGNPFVLLSSPTLYDKFNTGGELNLYDKTTGQGELTEEWIADRSKFLTWMIKANTLDKTTVSDGGSEQWVVEDKTLKGASEFLPYSLDINSGLFGTTGNARKMIFGKDTDDSGLLGGDKNDRIYGGAGIDTLDGGNGDDYLEGNSGDDNQKGGEGRDTLLGGANNDTLDGGKGNDTLNGGLGDDTYKFKSGDGWDKIEDSDGVGHLEYDGVTLSGGDYKADNVWQKTTNGQTLTYSLHDDTENGRSFKVLSIQGQDGGLRVKDWKSGQLGITLAGATPFVVPETASDIEGDLGANPLWSEADYSEELIGTAAAVHISSLRGDDWVAAGGGNDIVVGGSQLTYPGYIDYLMGDAGDDLIFADQEESLASLSGFGGNTPDDRIGDALFGGVGKDTLAGSDRHDVLFGGAGEDLLLGGAGNDVLNGDQDRKSATDVDFNFNLPYGLFDSQYIVYQRGGPNPNGTILKSGDYSTYTTGKFRRVVAAPEGGADIIYGGGNDLSGGVGVGRNHLLRCTGKNGQNRNVSGPLSRDFSEGGEDLHNRQAANDWNGRVRA